MLASEPAVIVMFHALAHWLCCPGCSQATASTAVISYAPTLFQRLGGSEMTAGMATGFTIGIAVTKVVSVGVGR
jgi:hypothetical protein